MDITSEQYVAEIKSIAASIVFYEEKTQLNDELIENAVDRHKWNQYNSYSLCVLMHTKNDDAFVNKYGSQALADFMEQNNESMCRLFNVIAHAAMCEDIKQEIEEIESLSQ